MFDTRADIELIFRDASGSTSALVVHIPITSTYAEAAAAAGSLAAAAVSLTGCVFVKRNIKYRVVRDDFPPAAIGSSVRRRAVLYFDTGIDTPPGSVEIPGPIDSIFLTSGVTAGYEVDSDNSDVIAFNNGLFANSASNPFGDAFVTFVIGYLQSRV